jgi:hypothetical protein
MNSSIPRAVFLTAIMSLILTVNVIRFSWLDKVPPGAHADETIDSANIECLATEGADAADVKMPFFSHIGYSFKPPNYIYPGVVWGKLFGFSVPSFRALAAFFVLVAIIGFFMLGRRLWGVDYGLWLSLVASLSPWMWPVSRIAFDSLVALPFFIWGLYFLFRSSAVRDQILAGVFLAGSLYGYSTFRMALPLMLPVLLLFRFRHDENRWRGIIALLVSLAVVLIPLASITLHGQLSRYFDSISIFSKEFLVSLGSNGSFSDLWQIFWRIYGMHLDPGYLFVHGQGTVMYLTRFSGVFGWLDIIGLMLGAFWILRFLVMPLSRTKERQYIPFILVCLACFFIGLLPVGLTQYNIPNVIRTSPAWFFAMMGVAFFLWRAAVKLKYVGIVFVIVGALFMGGYLRNYFTVYPAVNRMDFGVPYYELAQKAKTFEDWVRFVWVCGGDQMKARYYLMHNKGMTCRQAKDFYLSIAEYFPKK